MYPVAFSRINGKSKIFCQFAIILFWLSRIYFESRMIPAIQSLNKSDCLIRLDASPHSLFAWLTDILNNDFLTCLDTHGRENGGPSSLNFFRHLFTLIFMAKGVYKLRSEKIRSPGSPPPADSVFLLKPD